jgi:cystathionine beta-lyase
MKYDFDQVIDRRGTNSVKYDLREGVFGDPEVLPMWVADMDFPVADFILDAISERLSHPVLGYTYRSDAFSSSVVSWLHKRHAWTVEQGDICFSPGIVPALNMCVMEFSEPGDRIVVQPPVYFPFFTAVTNHKRELVYNQLVSKGGGYEMDFDHLEDIFQKGAKLFFLCHPHNPVGRVWSQGELEQLAALCLKYQVTVISDEIHSDLLLFGNRHIPFASLDKSVADLTLTCMAPSKTFNLAGLYTSVVIATHPALKRRYERILDVVHVGGDNILGQVALQAAYTQGHDWLDQLLTYLEGNYQLLIRRLEEEAPGIGVAPLQATYLSWLDFTKLGMEDQQLRDFMVKAARLGLNDGPMFGPGGEQHQRLNIATPSRILSEGIDRLVAALQKAR